jgi:hypothetical protein
MIVAAFQQPPWSWVFWCAPFCLPPSTAATVEAADSPCCLTCVLKHVGIYALGLLNPMALNTHTLPLILFSILSTFFGW